MIDVDQFRNRVQAVCRELFLRRLELIGSATRDDFSESSDIDVLVTFASDERLFERYFSLKEKLENIFSRKVDVIEERAIRNPYFRQAVEKNRIRIYGA